jgi:hypothetical protein
VAELVIGLWTFDGSYSFRDKLCAPDGSRTYSIDERMHGLDTAAQRIQNEVKVNSGTAKIDSILVAPEYLFSDRTDTGLRVPMDEKTRLLLERRLLELSGKYKRMLMFPGTLLYRKQLIRPDEAQFKFNKVTGLRDEKKQTPKNRRQNYVLKFGRAMDEAKELFEYADEREGVIVKGIERGENNPYLSPSLTKLHSALEDRLKRPRIVRNAAYVFLAGARIAKYDKRADFAETRGATADDMAFLPGTQKECPVIDGQRFGVEICYDHQIGVLRRRNIGDLRFHVLLSDPTKVKLGNMAMMKGGYFLHASTDSGATGVWSRNNNGVISKLDGKDSGSILAFLEEMHLFKITLS